MGRRRARAQWNNLQNTWYGFGKDVRGAIYTNARVGDVPGARGISFFLVEDQEVEISRLEDEMGLHTSATCEVVYDRPPTRLIGEEGKGLRRYGMAMMNGAHLGIAQQSPGIAQAAVSKARKCAGQRMQFGVATEELPVVRRLSRRERSPGAGVASIDLRRGSATAAGSKSAS